MVTSGHAPLRYTWDILLARYPMSICSLLGHIFSHFPTKDIFLLAPPLTEILHYSLSPGVFRQYPLVQSPALNFLCLSRDSKMFGFHRFFSSQSFVYHPLPSSISSKNLTTFLLHSNQDLCIRIGSNGSNSHRVDLCLLFWLLPFERDQFWPFLFREDQLWLPFFIFERDHIHTLSPLWRKQCLQFPSLKKVLVLWFLNREYYAVSKPNFYLVPIICKCCRRIRQIVWRSVLNLISMLIRFCTWDHLLTLLLSLVWLFGSLRLILMLFLVSRYNLYYLISCKKITVHIFEFSFSFCFSYNIFS